MWGKAKGLQLFPRKASLHTGRFPSRHCNGHKLIPCFFVCVLKNTGPLGECSCRAPYVVNSMKGVMGNREKPLSSMERDEILLLLHSWWGKVEANGNTFYVLKSTPCLMVTKTLPFLSSSACNPPRGMGEIELGLLFIEKETNILTGEMTCPKSQSEQWPIKMKQVSQGHEIRNRPITWGLL